VYFGDTVTCTVEITAVDGRGRAEARASYVNQAGVEVARAQLLGRVPITAAERAALAAMAPEPHAAVVAVR